MTISVADLETKYAVWFWGTKNAKQAKLEILALFEAEPDDEHYWSDKISLSKHGRLSSNGMQSMIQGNMSNRSSLI